MQQTKINASWTAIHVTVHFALNFGIPTANWMEPRHIVTHGHFYCDPTVIKRIDILLRPPVFSKLYVGLNPRA